MGNESKSEKYNEAVNRATGGKAGETSTEMAPPLGNAGAMISAFQPEDLNKLAATGSFEFAPQVMSLEPGQKIEGILEGIGPGNDFIDETTGVVRHVDSWIIASADGSLRVSILSSAQLDRKLPPFIGGPVGIARNKDIKISGGHKCADYHVWGPRRTDGTRRTWAALPAPQQQALPAGAPQTNVAQAAQNSEALA